MPQKEIPETRQRIADLVTLINDLGFLHVFRRHIGITPAPYGTVVRMVMSVMMFGRRGRSLVYRTVARSSRTSFHDILRYGLQIVRPADPREEIDKRGGEIAAVITQLGGLVIPWKYMMVIVPTLPKGAQTDGETVGRTDGTVKC